MTDPLSRAASLLCGLPLLIAAGGHAPQEQELKQYAQLPVYFEPNLGQTDPQVKFLARTSGYTLFLTEGEAVMVSSRGAVSRLKLEGAVIAAPLSGLEKQPGMSAYFMGNDPTKWRPEVPHYSRVQYKGVYPGIDVVYYGNQRQIEYDFVVAPGADPGRIRLAYEGPEKPRIDGSGDLLLGDITQRKPKVWQQIGTQRVEIPASYRLNGNRIEVQVAPYNRNQTLIIDPVLSLVYSTYLGGSVDDEALGIALDGAGAVYIAGQTSSLNFPTVNAYQSSLPSRNYNAFVTKLNPDDGNGPVTLAYSTYLGGPGNVGDRAYGIAVDGAGAAYVAGLTTSQSFPILHAFQSTLLAKDSVYGNAFVTKLNPYSGSGPVTLAYSTYLGGSGNDYAMGIAVDAAGAAYVAGPTSSKDFPTVNAYQPAFSQSTGSIAFITKLNAYSGAGLVTLAYSTYLGGSNNDGATAIAVDAAGAAYVAGEARSPDFPTVNAYQSTLPGTGNSAPFVAKLNPNNGSAPVTLAYSTFVGGSGGFDIANGIAVDKAGAAYVVGGAGSSPFEYAFAIKLNAYNGTGPVTLAYTTILEGPFSMGVSNSVSWGTGVAVDTIGAAYVVGYTNASNFPANAYQTSFGGPNANNAFVAKLNPSIGGFVYSTFLGGSGYDVGTGIAVDAGGQAYVTGLAQSNNFPIANAFQSSRLVTGNFGYNAFVTKFTSGISSPPFGSFDTPANNATIAGAVAVTGWTLDAQQIPIVDIWRDPIGSEPTQSNGLVYLGDGVFVSGARPDVTSAYPNYQNNTAAGWGYQLLTNELPNSNGSAGVGNGTYRLHAIAHNSALSAELGVKTITVNNATSLLPFGSIDTPAQGGTASGSAFVNFGWVLTPQSSLIPTDGSTISVYIDNAPVGHPVYNQPRSDIQTLFPGYQNTNGAVGYYFIDTTKLRNGVHSIAWVATDNNGHAQGIGSRYFTVIN